MDNFYNSNKRISFIRGATTSNGNTKLDISSAVHELIDELISRNNLEPLDILSITFTATKDLNACFPASVARKCKGLDSVAFLDCQQMFVEDDIKFCIRLMAQVNLPFKMTPKHPYLRGASNLRPDRS
tara:strand:- start:1195 stop:1578 length:384 start_codon:yes stop_codon:yes gene_type:complete